ncbi:MAG: hypothetical protein Q7S99_09185 [Parvibaculum sp.]|nr:hypothetical protein [Parvibaculum sp.]
MDYGVLAAIVVIFGGSIIGIFKTKTQGFGRYTTSVLVLTLILFVAVLCFALGKVEWAPMANLLFAIAGFAGGLITAKTANAD